MAVYSIYFSPTGGTKKVADIIACELCESFCPIDLIEKKELSLHFNEDDICIVSAPAFGGRVPQKAMEKLHSFSGGGAIAIPVAVFGNRAIDDTLIELYDSLSASGFKIIAGIEAVAEHSLARMYASKRPDGDDREELLQFAKKIKEKLTAKDFTAPEIPGNRPYKDFKASSMVPTVLESCIDCKKCARECPADAIPMDNIRTVDEKKCFSCMHCVAVCPTASRYDSPKRSEAFEERLRDRCSDRKPNKLYI